MKVQPINKSLNNGKQEYQVIGGIGTPFTEWTTLGYDKDNGRLISIPTIGRPQIVDLDHDGKYELVAVFDGTHLNPPNVYILRGNNGNFEIADIIKVTGSQYAKLYENENKTVLIEAGKNNDESHFYSYKDVKFLKIPV